MTDDLIFAVTHEEGGHWISFADWQTRAHSILFKDGTTWDEINGFRSPLFDYTKKSMAIIQSNWTCLPDERRCFETGRLLSEWDRE